MEDFLEITDPYQLSYIIHEHPKIEESVSYVVRDGFTVARVCATPTVYKTISKFNSGGTINAIEFTRIIKRIRGEMIQKKNEMKRSNTNDPRPFPRP